MVFGRAFAILIVILIVLPVLVVVMMSFNTTQSFRFPPEGFWLGYYRRFFTDPNWTGALFNSFAIGFGTMTLSMLLGAPASFALMRHQFRFRGLFRMIVLMPLTLVTWPVWLSQ